MRSRKAPGAVRFRAQQPPSPEQHPARGRGGAWLLATTGWDAEAAAEVGEAWAEVGTARCPALGAGVCSGKAGRALQKQIGCAP